MCSSFRAKIYSLYMWLLHVYFACVDASVNASSVAIDHPQPTVPGTGVEAEGLSCVFAQLFGVIILAIINIYLLPSCIAIMYL